MIKTFCIADFADSEKLKEFKPLIIGIKNKNTLHLKNVQCIPHDRMKVELDVETSEVVLRFKLRDNEFLALGDARGTVPTNTISV